MPRLASNQSSASAYTTDVDAGSVGQRVDNFLLRILKGVPRAHVYRLIRSGQVRINRGRVRASYRLKLGDKIRIPPVRAGAPTRTRVEAGGLAWLDQRIIFEDDRILVLDKPAGMAVHGGSGITLGCIEAIRCLRPRYPDMDLVHRLDRGTSGCLLIAKRRSTLRTLHGVLRNRGMDKRYLALVKGAWRLGSIRLEVPLTRDRRAGAAAVTVDPEGKSATSDFRVVQRYGSLASLMDVGIPTGRTHQIRVHAAHAGHPIAGDLAYGDPQFNERLSTMGLARMFLHAQALGFTWPGSMVEVAVSAPLPEDLRKFLDGLERARLSHRDSE